MDQSLNELVDTSSRDERASVKARHQELIQEVESLRELRQMAGKMQTDIAATLNIKQPSVSKIEKQADMYLSTLRSYVEAVGGELELTVKLPKRPAVRIQHLGDTTAAINTAPQNHKPNYVVARRRE